jgi:hypothetical protein
MPDIADLKKARREYGKHRLSAKYRGIGFELSFEQWCDIWEKSGKYPLRGRRMGQCGMQRYWDNGPYRAGNVEIGTVAENGRTRVYRNRYRAMGRKKGGAPHTYRVPIHEPSMDYRLPEEIIMAEQDLEMS